MIRFSIIIPTFNSERYLKFCLDSIVMQAYTNLQVVIVDNCSTDKTLEIIQNFKEKIEIFLISEPDDGINDAFRKGLRFTDGMYVCHMCSTDSYASTNWFSNASKFIEGLDYCDGLISDSALEIDEFSNPLYFWKPWVLKFMRAQPNYVRIEFSKLIGLSYPDMGWLMKREFALKYFPDKHDDSKYGHFAPFLGYMENIFINGRGVFIYPSVTSTGRHHEGQWTHVVKKQTILAKRTFRKRLFLNFVKSNMNINIIYLIFVCLPVYFIYFVMYGGGGSLLTKFKYGIKHD